MNNQPQGLQMSPMAQPPPLPQPYPQQLPPQVVSPLIASQPLTQFPQNVKTIRLIFSVLFVLSLSTSIGFAIWYEITKNDNDDDENDGHLKRIQISIIVNIVLLVILLLIIGTGYITIKNNVIGGSIISITLLCVIGIIIYLSRRDWDIPFIGDDDDDDGY